MGHDLDKVIKEGGEGLLGVMLAMKDREVFGRLVDDLFEFFDPLERRDA